MSNYTVPFNWTIHWFTIPELQPLMTNQYTRGRKSEFLWHGLAQHAQKAQHGPWRYRNAWKLGEKHLRKLEESGEREKRVRQEDALQAGRRKEKWHHITSESWLFRDQRIIFFFFWLQETLIHVVLHTQPQRAVPVGEAANIFTVEGTGSVGSRALCLYADAQVHPTSFSNTLSFSERVSFSLKHLQDNAIFFSLIFLLSSVAGQLSFDLLTPVARVRAACGYRSSKVSVSHTWMLEFSMRILLARRPSSCLETVAHHWVDQRGEVKTSVSQITLLSFPLDFIFSS